jgi:hypothetical protein
MFLRGGFWGEVRGFPAGDWGWVGAHRFGAEGWRTEDAEATTGKRRREVSTNRTNEHKCVESWRGVLLWRDLAPSLCAHGGANDFVRGWGSWGWGIYFGGTSKLFAAKLCAIWEEAYGDGRGFEGAIR